MARQLGAAMLSGKAKLKAKAPTRPRKSTRGVVSELFLGKLKTDQHFKA